MQNLIIYQFNTLHEILKELDNYLNFKIVIVKNENVLKKEIKVSTKYIIVTTVSYTHLTLPTTSKV